MEGSVYLDELTVDLADSRLVSAQAGTKAF